MKGQLKLSMEKVSEISDAKFAAFENALYFILFILQGTVNTLYVHTEHKRIKEEENIL
jgi:hypothetical protein